MEGVHAAKDSIYPEYYRSYILNHYFDTKGNWIFEQNAHDQQSFTETDTLAWFRFGKSYTIRSQSGRIMKTFFYDKENVFVGISDNLLIFREGNKEQYYYTAYELNGKVIFRIAFDGGYLKGIHRLSENVYGLDKEYGTSFCDSLGNRKPFKVKKFLFPKNYFSYSNKNYFDKNYFILIDEKTKRRGVVDRRGETLIGFDYKSIGEFVNGLSLSIKGEKFLFIDEKGNAILEVKGSIFMDKTYGFSLRTLQEPIGFYDDLCIGIDYIKIPNSNPNTKFEFYVRDDSTYFYYFDKTGKRQIELSGDIKFVGNFSEGLAPAVNLKGELGFINKKGNWAIKPAYELSVAGAYPLPYIVVPKFIGGYAYIKSFKAYIDKNGKKLFSGKRMKDRYDFSH